MLPALTPAALVVVSGQLAPTAIRRPWRPEHESASSSVLEGHVFESSIAIAGISIRVHQRSQSCYATPLTARTASSG